MTVPNLATEGLLHELLGFLASGPRGPHSDFFQHPQEGKLLKSHGSLGIWVLVFCDTIMLMLIHFGDNFVWFICHWIALDPSAAF